MQKTLEMPMDDRLMTADVRLELLADSLAAILESDTPDEDKLARIRIEVGCVKVLRIIDPVVEDTGA
jgi:hypothetical protein